MAVSSLMLMLSLIPALSLASSEAEAVPEAVNIQLGGIATLNCGEEPDKWIFNEGDNETVIEETGEIYVSCWFSLSKLVYGVDCMYTAFCTLKMLFGAIHFPQKVN